MAPGPGQCLQCLHTVKEGGTRRYIGDVCDIIIITLTPHVSNNQPALDTVSSELRVAAISSALIQPQFDVKMSKA